MLGEKLSYSQLLKELVETTNLHYKMMGRDNSLVLKLKDKDSHLELHIFDSRYPESSSYISYSKLTELDELGMYTSKEYMSKKLIEGIFENQWFLLFKDFEK